MSSSFKILYLSRGSIESVRRAPMEPRRRIGKALGALWGSEGEFFSERRNRNTFGLFSGLKNLNSYRFSQFDVDIGYGLTPDAIKVDTLSHTTVTGGNSPDGYPNTWATHSKSLETYLEVSMRVANSGTVSSDIVDSVLRYILKNIEQIACFMDENSFEGGDHIIKIYGGNRELLASITRFVSAPTSRVVPEDDACAIEINGIDGGDDVLERSDACHPGYDGDVSDPGRSFGVPRPLATPDEDVWTIMVDGIFGDDVLERSDACHPGYDGDVSDPGRSFGMPTFLLGRGGEGALYTGGP